jgi:O-antigen/teichoic acid export membrane protein
LGLGAEQYGLYTVLFLFLGYAAALDLGLSFSLVKRIAEHDPERQRGAIESLVNAAAAVYATVALLFMLALVLGRSWVAHDVLKLPERLVPTAEAAALILACSVPFTTAITIFGALFRGLLRFEYVALFSLMNGSLYAVGAAILVASGAELRALLGLYAGLMAASSLAQWVVLRRLLPGLRIVPTLQRSTLRELFAFGSFMMFNQVGQIALLQLDRVVISRLLSVAMTAYYAVPLSISQRVGMLGAAAATVAFPRSSGSLARGELHAFRREYLHSTRVVAWLTVAPALVVIVFADKLLTFWMSPAFAANGTVPLRLLSFAAFWIAVASLGAVSIEGSGRPWVTSAFIAFSAALNVIGLLVLTPRRGLDGAAASVTIALLVLAALNVWYCGRKVTAASVREWVRSVVLPVIWTTFAGLPVALLLRQTVTGVPSLVVSASVAAGFACVVGYWVFLSAEERRWAKARVARLWSRANVAGNDAGGG